MTLIRNSKVKKLLQTISRTDNPSRLPKISSSNRIPGNVETQNAAIDKLMKKQERYETICREKVVKMDMKIEYLPSYYKICCIVDPIRVIALEQRFI